jgi:pimeloyl-ACP methyl ester carboxylesterase
MVKPTSAAATPPFKSIAGGEARTVAFGTNKVHYLTLGEGIRTLVFIHGWACNLNFWREQVSAFADKAKLIFIDLPGHGKSDKPNTAYTMDFLARAVVAVLRDARVEKAVLIGHSMGASVMCRVYQQAPEKVAALVSVDGLLCRPPGTPEKAELFIGQFRVPEWQAHARNFFRTFFPCPGTENLRDEVVAEMLTTPQFVIAAEAEGMVGLDQPDWALQNVGVPVLALNARSPLWSDRYEHYVRLLSAQVDYRMYDGVGHFLMLEKPTEFNANLTEMLRKFDLLPK